MHLLIPVTLIPIQHSEAGQIVTHQEVTSIDFTFRRFHFHRFPKFLASGQNGKKILKKYENFRKLIIAVLAVRTAGYELHTARYLEIASIHVIKNCFKR